jgi:hypothetical protein
MTVLTTSLRPCPLPSSWPAGVGEGGEAADATAGVTVIGSAFREASLALVASLRGREGDRFLQVAEDLAAEALRGKVRGGS